MRETAPVIINSAFRDRFTYATVHSRIILFCAPCGCGKTTVAVELLRGHRVDFRKVEDGRLSYPPCAPDTEYIVIDDLQELIDPDEQVALRENIRSNPTMKYLLLSRGASHGWLMPFVFAGVVERFDTQQFLLTQESTAQMLRGNNINVSPADISAICRDLKGFPAALSILCRRMSDGRSYSPELFADVKRNLFLYFHESVFRRFDKPIGRLLLDLSPFESFTAEMAKVVSGNPAAGELLGRLTRESSMMIYDDVSTYRIYPIFREFLLWEAEQNFSRPQELALFANAGLYYELAGDIPQALECYSKSGDSTKISLLLEKHAALHPGAGHYYETEPYYRALPEEEILRSPALMCGMSMLCAMTVDFEQSERWYQALQNYASRLKPSDSEYREVRGKISYLDIALPQRGCNGLIELIGTVFKVMSDKEMFVPSFSVTSTMPSIMNGGKDFCDWSKQDDLLYATMRRPVEAVLGRDGVGLADCAICESKLEKGADISGRLLNLVSRLGEIQNRGTPDIEFAVVGLLARDLVLRGDARAARDTILTLRERFIKAGESRFLPNIDALLCRIAMRTGDTEQVELWRREKAPQDFLRLRALWRYQYLTLSMVQLARGEYSTMQILLAPLRTYCQMCGRRMDLIHINLLSSICLYRQENPSWKEQLSATIDTLFEYNFITPAAQYGAAILPLLTVCGWSRNVVFFKKLLSASRAQAVLYPEFMRISGGLAEPLTAAETQVLRLLCHDMSNQEIGEILDIKLPTVKSHVSHILQKLGAGRRTEAKAAAERLHLID